MKKVIIITLILGLCIPTPTFAITRDVAYRYFGPKLLEAIVRVIKNEINLLRAQHGLPARTNQQIIDAVKNELDSLPDYDWMGEGN